MSKLDNQYHQNEAVDLAHARAMIGNFNLPTVEDMAGKNISEEDMFKEQKEHPERYHCKVIKKGVV